ncbi:hypothetical protein GCM10022222_23830 [Amycolatopsis ultiminotia]|uniref:Uncharacterized protein n=1 Tax=Amycolatopsis ultiminotia TaxID=543629 RepID=A0ABP6VTL6_9PSEU
MNSRYSGGGANGQVRINGKCAVTGSTSRPSTGTGAAVPDWAAAAPDWAAGLGWVPALGWAAGLGWVPALGWAAVPGWVPAPGWAAAPAGEMAPVGVVSSCSATSVMVGPLLVEMHRYGTNVEDYIPVHCPRYRSGGSSSTSNGVTITVRRTCAETCENRRAPRRCADRKGLSG